ncbi:MAG: hypothetical protein Kow00122_10740 [Thermoleophilia bacterium]
MRMSRLPAAVLAATLPFFFVMWVELVGVDQPQTVDPGQAFTATVRALAHGATTPDPLDPTVPGSAGETVTPRLGVLAPSDWEITGVTLAVAGAETPLEPAAGEAWVYEAYYPAPPGYTWRPFVTAPAGMADGTALAYHVKLRAGSRAGLYRIVYMSWTQPPYWYIGPAKDVPQADGGGTGTGGGTAGGGTTGGADGGGTGGGTTGGTGGGTSDFVPVPPPSFLETTVTVGEVGPPPRIVGWDPPDGAADVPLNTDVRVTFDRDMDQASLRDGGLQLYAGPVWLPGGRPAWRPSTELDPTWTLPPFAPAPVPAQIFYNAATRTAVLHPLSALAPRTVHTAVVGPTVRAADGVPVAEPTTASFLTVGGPLPPPFSDVPPQHRFREAIEALAQAGIVGGFPDGTFRPDEPVTRGQLARMLVALLGLHTPEPGPPPPFQDVPAAPGDPLADYLGEAARAGIATGFNDGTFRPYDGVTRIQLVRMVVRAAQPRLSPPPPDFSAGFRDVDAADQGFANWAFYNDLVDGKTPGHFDPWSTATRGHAARILYGVWRLPGGPEPLPGSGDSGISGLVLLGPLTPVSEEGLPTSRPYAATIVVRSADAGDEITRFRSGTDGRFSVSLPPGEYLLDPVPGGDPLPRAIRQKVSVEPHRYTVVTIEYDTGIR